MKSSLIILTLVSVDKILRCFHSNEICEVLFKYLNLQKELWNLNDFFLVGVVGELLEVKGITDRFGRFRSIRNDAYFPFYLVFSLSH